MRIWCGAGAFSARPSCWASVTPNYSFALRAPRDEWEAFWKRIPEPGHNDIFALFKRGKLSIEGDLHPFMANLLYIKDVLAAPRKEAKGERSDAFFGGVR